VDVGPLVAVEWCAGRGHPVLLGAREPVVKGVSCPARAGMLRGCDSQWKRLPAALAEPCADAGGQLAARRRNASGQ
jgi:hypothetical protein